MISARRQPGSEPAVVVTPGVRIDSATSKSESARACRRSPAASRTTPPGPPHGLIVATTATTQRLRLAPAAQGKGRPRPRHGGKEWDGGKAPGRSRFPSSCVGPGTDCRLPVRRGLGGPQWMVRQRTLHPWPPVTVPQVGETTLLQAGRQESDSDLNGLGKETARSAGNGVITPPLSLGPGKRGAAGPRALLKRFLPGESDSQPPQSRLNRVHGIQRLDSTEPAAHCSCCCVDCLLKRLCQRDSHTICVVTRLTSFLAVCFNTPDHSPAV
jgi:hypothetical protein